MRPDKPLPGDLVIRYREEGSGLRRVEVWVIHYWPDVDRVVGGPYQSYAYALQQARQRLRDTSEWIWRDHARVGESEQLESVTGNAMT